MAKIKKNLSDSEMLKGYKETVTFENMFEEETPKPKVKAPKEENDFFSSFFTKELKEKVGKQLLEIKLELYKQGITDFELKASREGTKVIIEAKEIKKKSPK